MVVYANGLGGGFTYDDKAIIRDNPRLRAPARAAELWTTEYFGGPPGTGTAYRPALLSSFAVEWWIHGGEPFLFHAVNVLLHAAATLLLATLLLRLRLSPALALGAALLFAVHPIHVEAVTSLVGRGETQAAALALAFLLLALRAVEGGPRSARALLLALVCYALASLTKESAAVSPMLLALALSWLEEGSLLGRVWAALRRGLPVYIGCAATLAGIFWARARVLGGPLKSPGTGIFALENPLAPLASGERALNASVLFFRALGRMALPLRLSADESAWSIPLVPRGGWLGWTCAGLLAALVILSLWRLLPRVPAALGFLWLGVASLPTSNLAFPTGTIFAERLAYLPSAGFCLIAAAWILGDDPPRAARPGLRRAALGALALALAARTVIRNPVWHSDETLFSNLLRTSPASAKAHYDFAYMSSERGDFWTALAEYTRATQIYPGYWDAWSGRGRMERELGNLIASEEAYAQTLRLAPFVDAGSFGVGLAREIRGELAAAEQSYRDGLRHLPRSFPLAYRLAVVLTAEARPAALHAWHRALAIEPGSLPARVGYVEWLAAAGRPDQARRELAELLRLAPRYAPALKLKAALNP